MITTCSPCRRGAHGLCTAPASCECGCKGARPRSSNPTGTRAVSSVDDLEFEGDDDDLELPAEKPTADEGIEWEDPPAKGGRRTGQWEKAPWVPTLRANPGRWARVASYEKHFTANDVVSRLRQGRLKGFDPAEWEAVGRSDKAAGTSALWLRYVGPALRAVANDRGA